MAYSHHFRQIHLAESKNVIAGRKLRTKYFVTKSIQMIFHRTPALGLMCSLKSSLNLNVLELTKHFKGGTSMTSLTSINECKAGETLKTPFAVDLITS